MLISHQALFYVSIISLLDPHLFFADPAVFLNANPNPVLQNCVVALNFVDNNLMRSLLCLTHPLAPTIGVFPTLLIEFVFSNKITVINNFHAFFCYFSIFPS